MSWHRTFKAPALQGKVLGFRGWLYDGGGDSSGTLVAKQRLVMSAADATCFAPGATSRDLDAALNRAMDRYATGEDAAFAELFRLLAPRLRAFLRRLSASDDIADDLLQETLLRIHHARGSFNPGRATAPVRRKKEPSAHETESH